MIVPVPIYKNADMVLYYDDVEDRDGTPITNGTVTYTIESKFEVDGEIEEIDSGTLPWDAVRTRYEKTINKTITNEITVGRRYVATMVFTNPDGKETQEQLEMYGANKGRT